MTLRDTDPHGMLGSVTHPALQGLDVLVGTWDVASTDGTSGRVTFEWMEGGHFLMQFADLHRGGVHVTGLEVIGFDAERGGLRSQYYETTGALTHFAWELDGQQLTIWEAEAGSSSFYRGTFDPYLVELSGTWTGPDTTFDSTLTRVL